jgi:hypothetical protein
MSISKIVEEQKGNISVEVLKIKVTGKRSGYFTIDYKYKVNKGKWFTTAYTSSWSSQSASGFRKKLKKNYALTTAFENVVEQLN